MKHIQLPDAEPRCRNRSRACPYTEKCARNRAAIPTTKASIGDFSRELMSMAIMGQIIEVCAMFRACEFDKPAAERPAVKPAMGGLA